MSWGEILGGVGLFIFGMLQFEQAIKQLSGKTIKRVLQHYTNKVWKGITMGMGMTAMVQSSTIVSLVVVGFVGAGLLSLHNAMSVVVGANLGSTFTPWMVALLGFKTDIFSLAFYFVGVGGFGVLFTNEYSKAYSRWKLLLGFGLLFLGLDVLKESVATLTTQIDISIFANISLVVAIGIGLAMAFIMQTSAATSVVILSALYAQMIDFQLAVSIMIGANLGSAFSTAVMGSLSGSGKSRAKRQLMIGHALFNLICAILIVTFLPRVLKLVGLIVRNGDPIISLTVFHTLFNLTGVILLSPLIGVYTRWISRVLPAPKEGVSLHIYQVGTTMPEEVLVALEKDLEILRINVHEFIQSCFGFHRHKIEEDIIDFASFTPRWKRIREKVTKSKRELHETIVQYHPDPIQARMKEYKDIKHIETELYTFIIRLPKEEFVNGAVQKLNAIQDRMYSLLDAAKIIKDNMNHIEHISYMDEEHIASYWMHLCQQLEQAISANDEHIQAHVHDENGEGDSALYNFLQEQTLMENREEEGLSNQDIAEILKTSRHALYVITLLKKERSQNDTVL